MAEPADTVVLIGPVCTGKSTLLPLVAARLGRHHVDLDAIAEPYYEEVARGRAAFLARIEATSRAEAHEWWQEGHPHAVRRVLADHAGSVIAFGAGHTSYRNATRMAEVRDALESTNAFVVLVLPCEDGDRAVEILRARSMASRGRDWIERGTDFIARWVDDPAQRALPTITVFTDGRTPEETADEIAGAATRHR
jgi:shikimate kinase